MTATIVTTEAFANGVPTLPNDPAADAGTMFLYDLLDPACWASQAAPSNGNSVPDLGAEEDAATVAGTVGWSNGFVFNPGNSTNRLALPVSSKLASGATGFGIAFSLSIASNANLSGIAGIGNTGTWTAAQWALFFPTGGGALSARFNGTAITTTFTPTLGQIYHIALTAVLSGADYTVTVWVDGVSVGSATIAGPIAQPTAGFGNYGTVLGVTGGAVVSTLRRIHANDLSVKTAAEFVAADIASRPEWWA